MSEIETGIVIEVQVVSYDVKKVPTIDATKDYSPYNYKNIVDNCSEINETLILRIQDDTRKNFPFVERISDLGITSSWFCAIDCLAVGLYDPSVLFASIAVECVLNHDLRLEELRQNEPYKWIDLNWKNLKRAHEKGLPTHLLLKENETFEEPSSIEFVNRRNKVAHGDIEGYSNMYPPAFQKDAFQNDAFQFGHERPSKQHALDQIEKSKRFIVEWAKQKPKVRLH